MTPAIDTLRELGVFHDVLHYEPGAEHNIGIAAARALDLPDQLVFKTLIARLPTGAYCVAIVPVAATLDLKRLARECGVKSAVLAHPDDARRLTGYEIGGISPLGTRRTLPALLDASAQDHPTIYVSAGRRGLELGLATEDLIRCCNARLCRLTRK